MGVIAVETRTMEAVIPADPANPDSRETVLTQAGQVWFPDSAFKTAQAIEDFNKAENLPLIIFANWRGFSGGTRDMYSEILKFGSYIVDNLREYKHPVFVYIPPAGELRGGAWVVVDPTINLDMMEMYADKDSRGGILEPPGICDVKYRQADLVKTMHRMDKQLQEWDSELEGATVSGDEAQADALKTQIKKRESDLLPMYVQISYEFADLHDRPGRMKAKGVIRDVVDWTSSRQYFYWRLRRRLAEDSVCKGLRSAGSEQSFTEIRSELREMLESKGLDWEDDKACLEAYTSSDVLADKLSSTKQASVVAAVQALLATLDKDQVPSVLSSLE